MKKTKIVATLGPASSTPEIVGQLIDAGMNIARINFSHGTHDEHRKLFEIIKEEAAKRKQFVAVLGDLCGPKIRTGNLKNGVRITENTVIKLIEGSEIPETEEIIIPVNYENIINDLSVNEEILFDDGKYKVQVISKTSDYAECKVIRGGLIKSHKGVNLPGTTVSSGSLTQKDIEDAYFGIDLGLDYFALSFVQTAEDIEKLREITGKTPIIAKIERPQAVQNLSSIMDTADGFMVARGDLGVEAGFENVPVIQKKIITEAIARAKPVITATQMLESMINSPVPTRAEVSDVANAVLDGTSAVMLSAESAAGKYPVEAVKFMSSIIKKVESNPMFDVHFKHSVPRKGMTGAIAYAASTTAQDLNIKTMVVFSVTGKTAKEIARFRHNINIIALSPWLEVLNQLSLEWGVLPVYSPSGLENTEDMMHYAESILKKYNLAAHGEQVIITFGFDKNGPGHTNALKVHTV